MTYARRVDANHGLILAAARAVGAHVEDTGRVGGGFPDALILWRGKCLPVEIKDGKKSPSRRKLTPSQADKHPIWAAHGVPITVVKTVDDVHRLLGVL